MSETTVASIADLNAAILAANTLTSGTDTIVLAGDIAMDGTALASIELAAGVSLTLEGEGYTLDGGGTEHGLFVYSGAATVESLTIANAVAQGGNGATGGGGGAGLGGGLFVGGTGYAIDGPAAVTLMDVAFQNDSANGGGGGVGREGQAGTQGSGGGLDGGNTPPEDGFGSGGIGFANNGHGGGGGFGGGGGAGVLYGGTPGFGGAIGHPYGDGYQGSNGDGGGGLGAGGDIFVQQGGMLSIESGSLAAGNVAPGGSYGYGHAGQAFGNGIFIQGDQSIGITALAGQTTIIEGVIADEAGSGGTGFGSVLIGDGSATAAGTVLLTAAETYLGGTEIQSGTLQLGAGGTSGMIAGNATIDGLGVLVFDHADVITFVNILTGAGRLVQAGGGTLVLNGADSLTGATDVENGMLQIGAGGTLGALDGPVSLSSGTTILFDRGDAAALAGMVSGAGTVAQDGTGALTLSGNNDFSGGLVLNAGTLVLANRAAAGNGVIEFGTASSLVLDIALSDAPTNSIAGFLPGETIDLQNAGLASAVSLTECDLLLVTLATGTTALQLAAQDYSHDVFGAVSDGAGGSDLAVVAAVYTASNAAQLGADLRTIGLYADVLPPDTGFTIHLAGAGISTGVALPEISLSAGQSLLIDGTGGALDGPEGLTIAAGAVLFSNLTLAGGDILEQGSGPIIVASGTLQAGANNMSGAIDANVSIAAGAVLEFDHTDSITYAGLLSGAGQLVQAGSGVLTLSAASGYAGGTTLAAGGLAIENSAAAGSGNITVGSAYHLTLDIGAGDAPANTIAGFIPGETIDLQGIGLATSATLHAGNTLLVTAASGTVALHLGADANIPGTVFELTPDGAGGADIVPVVTQYDVSTEAQLNAALIQIALESPNLPPGDAITLDLSGSSIALTTALEAVNMSGGGTLVIDGGGGTLNGLGDQRGLFIYAGNVVVENLTIANAAAIGGPGGSSISAFGPKIIGGGGGGAGLGGGLFVAGSANDGAAPASVTLRAVSFTDDLAQGGAGGYEYNKLGTIALSGGGGLGGNGGLAGGGGVGQSASGGGFTPYPPNATPGANGIIPFAGGGGEGGFPQDSNTISNPVANQAYLVGAEGGANGGGGGGGGEYAGEVQDYPNEYQGGGGGVDGAAASQFSGGGGGAGGFGGGGGAGYFDAGAGGFGGGGGAGYDYGGAGGFGGGGGAGGDGAGGGGFGAGTGGVIGGGGGLGAGGDIFVQQGATLVVEGGSLATGTVTGGAAGQPSSPVGGTSGSAFGSGIFLQGFETIALNAAAGQTVELDGVIADQSGAGGTDANAGLGGIIAGDFSGLETGTLLFTADNTYLGGTSIESGTLQLGTGGATGMLAGNVSLGADTALVFDRGDNPIFAATLSGAGALIQEGGGTLILTGDDDYTGGNTIASGALQLGTGGNSGLITGNISLAAGTSLIIDHDDTVNLTGNITGAGGVTFEGGGVLSLSGANAFTGGVDFVSGTLALERPNAAGGGVLQFGTQQGLALDIGAGDVPQNLIAGFAPGDIIDLQGFSATGATLNAGFTLQVSGAAGTVALTLGNEGSLAALPFITGSDGNGGTEIIQLATVYNVLSEAQLNSALQIIDSFGGALAADTQFTINLPGGEFALSSALDPVSLAAGQSLLINGVGSTLDGQGSVAGLVARSGSLTLSDLIIANAAVTGSTAGGVGGPGLGGGLFAGADASITLQNIAFVNDSAIGGAGGSVSTTSDGGFGTGGAGSSGLGGFGAGNGAPSAGGGGLGAGGDIFVQSGSTLVIQGGNIGYGGAQGGAGGSLAQSGFGISTGVFLQGTASIDFVAATGQNLEITGDIYDQTGAGEVFGQPFPGGAGSVIIGDPSGHDDGAVLFYGYADEYTGGTDIESGTLITGGSGFFAGPITIAQNAGLEFTGGNAAISGVISGAGSLVVGSGGLALSAANGFSGGVTIASGDLTLENAQAAGTGTIAFGQSGGLALQIGAGDAPENIVSGFVFGDVIDLQGIGTASGATVNAVNTLIVTGSSASVGLALSPAQSYAGDVFLTTADGAGGTDISVIPELYQAADETALNAAIIEIAAYDTLFAAGTDFTIAITAADLSLSSALEAVSLAAGYTLSIEGEGNTLDGGDTQRGLFIYSGDVEVSNLTIANALALGGNGGSGAAAGGGGAGLGGGLFVAGTANGGAAPASVALDDVSFSNDAAHGGAAGTGNPYRVAGGGGGGMGQGGASSQQSSYAGNGGGVGTGSLAGTAGIIPGASPENGGTAPVAVRRGAAGGGAGGVAGTGGRSGNYYAGNGGAGGFGGGGGGGLAYYDDFTVNTANGGKGGFGGGGGGAGSNETGEYGYFAGGSGGWGGGGGSEGYGFAAPAGFGATGGNGLGAGGDIFVQQGGSLIIEGGSLAAGTVQNGGPAAGLGNGLFLQGNQAATFGALAGQTLAITGVIADQSGAGGSGGNAGAGSIIIGSTSGALTGTVELAAANLYTGGTTIESGGLILGAAGAAGSGDIVFGGGDPPSLTFSTADAPTNIITGFTFGDVIDITDLDFSSTTTLYVDGNGVLAIPDADASGGVLDLTFAGIGITTPFILAAGGGDITIPCFCAGTRILGLDGEILVEDIQLGDTLITLRENGPLTQKVIWTGRRAIDIRRHPEPGLVRPICITAGAVAFGVPERDLRLSPEHAVYLDGNLFTAASLVNGTTIFQERNTTHVTYHHIALETHDILMADGLACESFLDTGNKTMFETGLGIIVLHPDFRPAGEASFCAPLLREGEALERVRARLAHRARNTA